MTHWNICESKRNEVRNATSFYFSCFNIFFIRKRFFFIHSRSKNCAIQYKVRNHDVVERLLIANMCGSGASFVCYTQTCIIGAIL